MLNVTLVFIYTSKNSLYSEQLENNELCIRNRNYGNTSLVNIIHRIGAIFKLFKIMLIISKGKTAGQLSGYQVIYSVIYCDKKMQQRYNSPYSYIEKHPNSAEHHPRDY